MSKQPASPSVAPGEPPPRKTIPKPDPVFAALVVLAGRLVRYWRDIVAVLLVAWALITLLGIFGLSSGFLLEAWNDLLVASLGWGAVIVPLTLGGLGIVMLAHNFGRPLAIRWGRIIAAELAACALLGMLNGVIGGSVARAAAGEGGGAVGWGIGLLMARIFPAPVDMIVLALCFLGMAALSLEYTNRRLAQWLGWDEPETADEMSGALVEVPSPATARAESLKPLTAARRRPRLAGGERVRVPLAAADEARRKPRKRDKRLPPLDLLEDGELRRPAQKDIDETASIIVKTLKEFGVPVTVVGAQVGPTVTQFQVVPGFVEKAGQNGVSRQWKVRVAQISNLADDLALALSANTLRIEAPVPGQNYVGIEVPNSRVSMVNLRPVIESEAFQSINSPLAIALGRDVSGASVAADLGAMPHLLIAGTTGSGKSVCITSLITCLAMNNTPDDLRLVLIDPKMVELVRFNGLPHLYGKVETDLDRILGVLRWVMREMDQRYRLFEGAAARNLDAYNGKLARKKDGERLPRIVVFIDELADLMMRAPDETERIIVRLAQMARATGIHLVVATQRPSTDIVTGLIKANFPARISFAVASSIDSRVILDTTGAETLLGRGDMLYLAPEVGAPVRLQGCYVSDAEVDRIVDYWREQAADDEPADGISETEADADGAAADLPPALAPWDEMLAREAVLSESDEQLEAAIELVKKYGTASTSLLQRKLRLGYPRAARLMDELRRMGVVGREQAGGKTREVLIRGDDDPIARRAAQILGDEDDDR